MTNLDALLEQEVNSADGPELRRLLLQKAVGLCDIVRQGWSGGDVQLADQWVLRIQDILIELLDGVQDPRNTAAASLSDLYVYLLRLAHESMTGRSSEGIDALKQILEIELETWTLVGRGKAASGSTAANRIDAGGLAQYGTHTGYESELPQGLDLSF